MQFERSLYFSYTAYKIMITYVVYNHDEPPWYSDITNKSGLHLHYLTSTHFRKIVENLQTFRSVTTINTAKDDAAADDGDDDDKEEESYGTPLVTSMDLVEEELANMSVSDVVTTSSSSAVPTAMTSLISSADKSSRTKVTLSVLPMHTYRHHTGWSIRFIHRKMNPSVYCLMKQSDIAQAV